MTTNKIVGERAVLFVLIGWATNYDGSEPVHGSHSYLQEHPQDNSEASAFSERKDGFFVDIAGGTPAAHYMDGHREYDGIVLPVTRVVHGRDDDGRKVPEPITVSIDIDDVRVR